MEKNIKMNRTEFIKILESLDYYVGSISYGKDRLDLGSSAFQDNLKKTIKILKEHDEEWKREQEAKPLLWVFIKELKKKTAGHFTFKIGDDIVFKDTQLPYLAGSELMEKNIVVSHELKRTDNSWQTRQTQFGIPDYECTIVIDEAKNYDNVKCEAE